MAGDGGTNQLMKQWSSLQIGDRQLQTECIHMFEQSNRGILNIGDNGSDIKRIERLPGMTDNYSGTKPLSPQHKKAKMR